MKTLVFATLALLFFVAVESLNLKGLEVKLTKQVKFQELKPLTSEKRNLVNKALLAEKRAPYARQAGSPYQPMLLVSDTTTFYLWVENRDYTFGLYESAGENPISGAPIFKYDNFFPLDGEPGYYVLVSGFVQDSPDILEGNLQNYDIMVCGMGFTEPDSGTHLTLPLPFSNAIVVDAAVVFTKNGDPFAQVDAEEVVLNEEGNEVVSAFGGAFGVSGKEYDGALLVVVLANPLETTPSEGTDVTVTYIPTNENSGDTDLPTTFQTESFTRTTQTSEAPSSESQSESQATQTSQATSQTATSQTQSGSESSDSATDATSEATGTQTSQQTQTQTQTTQATTQAGTTDDPESGAVAVVASVLVMVSALMVQFA